MTGPRAWATWRRRAIPSRRAGGGNVTTLSGPAPRSSWPARSRSGSGSSPAAERRRVTCSAVSGGARRIVLAVRSPVRYKWRGRHTMIPRYSRPELAALWDDKHRFELWLSVELAACRAMERVGSVPQGTADQVAAAAVGKLDPRRILEIEATTRHDVIAFLTHVEELAGEPARWLHLGMTSSDVLDTTLAIQTSRALDHILDAIGKLQAALARRAREQAATPMIGRSHGIHAEPITAGLTFA